MTQFDACSPVQNFAATSEAFLSILSAIVVLYWCDGPYSGQNVAESESFSQACIILDQNFPELKICLKTHLETYPITLNVLMSIYSGASRFTGF